MRRTDGSLKQLQWKQQPYINLKRSMALWSASPHERFHAPNPCHTYPAVLPHQYLRTPSVPHQYPIRTSILTSVSYAPLKSKLGVLVQPHAPHFGDVGGVRGQQRESIATGSRGDLWRQTKSITFSNKILFRKISSAPDCFVISNSLSHSKRSPNSWPLGKWSKIKFSD